MQVQRSNGPGDAGHRAVRAREAGASRGPTLRVHFTAQDILRTRVLGAPDPMWELVLSTRRLREPPRCAAHARWRAAIRPELVDHRTRAAARLLSTLIPQRGDLPDSLTPYPNAEPFESALRDITSNGAGGSAAELVPAPSDDDPGNFGHAVAEGDRSASGQLTEALRHYYETLLRPHWATIDAAISRDTAERGRRQLAGGMEALLGTLCAGARWRWPVLELPHPRAGEWHLRGQGVLLVPSFFCGVRPVTVLGDGHRPVLALPALHTDGTVPVEAEQLESRLGAVLGTTRARILLALRRPHSTSSLAGTIDMSIASASQQVALLRKAGLVRSRRAGQAVLHTITARGKGLLGD